MASRKMLTKINLKDAILNLEGVATAPAAKSPGKQEPEILLWVNVLLNGCGWR